MKMALHAFFSRTKIQSVIVFAALLLSGCTPSGRQENTGKITGNLEKHILALASDSTRGRMPMSPEEPAIVGYIAREMEKAGLEPAFNGSYFQKVPILQVTSSISPTLDFSTPAGELKLDKISDYVAFTRKVSPFLALEKSELLFTGFGITAPEYDRNDFAGVDVKGKTILVFVNDPGYGSEGSYFKGNEMTYYGRWTYKFEEAARQGARACLIIHENGPAGYGWNVVSNNGETTRIYLEPEDGYRDRCDLEGWISAAAARRLFGACGLDFDTVKANAVASDFRPFPLPVSVSGWIRNEFRTGVSSNVGGWVRGATRPEETVVYTAHWDHLGTGTPVRGDSIFNGATDNASGVAWLIETARRFKTGPQPARSVLFLCPTCEESGLLGSEYYTLHPAIPLEGTVACINSDVILFLGRFKDLTLTGYGHSNLDSLVSVEAARQGRYITPDPDPDNGMFFRSDQFPFVKRGIPAVFAKGYTDAEKYGREKTAAIIRGYWDSVYHTPADEYLKGRDDLSGLAADVLLLYGVGYRLASSDFRPSFLPGSEFYRAPEPSE